MLFTRMDPFNFKNKFLSQATTLLVGKYHKEENHPISKFLLNTMILSALGFTSS